MSWEIFIGIAALVAFIIPIGKIISNNTEALTELKVSIQNLIKNDTQQDNDIKELQEEVGNHEVRITVLEEKKR